MICSPLGLQMLLLSCFPPSEQGKDTLECFVPEEKQVEVETHHVHQNIETCLATTKTDNIIVETDSDSKCRYHARCV